MIATEIETTLPYKIWTVIESHPGCNMQFIARQLGMGTREISSPMTKLCRAEKLVRTGIRGKAIYTIRRGARPPNKHGRGTYKPKDFVGEMTYVTSHDGNTIFEECRQNWPGYELNKRLREVRANELRG